MKNLRSTKNEEDLDFFPTKSNEWNNKLFVHIVPSKDLDDKQKGYCDLTGRFPYKSSRGTQYLFVMYDYDSNAILFEGLKTRQSGEN